MIRFLWSELSECMKKLFNFTFVWRGLRDFVFLNHHYSVLMRDLVHNPYLPTYGTSRRKCKAWRCPPTGKPVTSFRSFFEYILPIQCPFDKRITMQQNTIKVILYSFQQYRVEVWFLAKLLIMTKYQNTSQCCVLLSRAWALTVFVWRYRWGGYGLSSSMKMAPGL